MKLKLLILLTLFFLLLNSPVADAQEQTPITADQPFDAWVIFIEDLPGCAGSLSLTSPFEQHIFDYSHEPMIENIGSFGANTELVFSLTPSPPCSTATLFSDNPNHVYIEEYGENAWGLIWFVPGQESGVLTFVGLQLHPSASHHPVIFIHGLGGRPEDWTTGDKRVYIDTLKSDPYNYPSDYMMTYAYADADGNPNTYDYQGDITKISDDLGGYVNELSQRHLADGGDGKVDIVGFSLGGLIARQYLNENPDDHRVRKLITIASPHRGVFWFNADAWLDAIPIVGSYMRRVLNTFLETTILVPFMHGPQPLDLDSPAAQQVVPGNSFLQLLNDNTPTEPDYSVLYGDIDAELVQKLFFFTLRKKITLGDGYILPNSATGIPIEGLKTYGFTDEPIFEMEIESTKLPGGGYEYVLDAPSIGDQKVWHGNLIVHPDVVQKVIGILTE